MNLFSDLIPEIIRILKDLIYFCETLLNYGKEEKKEVIKMEDVKSIAFDFELSVPKKEFDELLRRMAHIKAEEESPNEETDKKEEKEE